MKIKYYFITGEKIEIEVDDEYAEVVIELEYELKNNNRKETRRHESLDLYDKDFKSKNIGSDTYGQVLKNFNKDKLYDAIKQLTLNEQDLLHNLDWYRNKLYGDELAKKYDIWIAQWNVEKPAVNCGIWQKSDCGKINGIAGNVDLNEAYKDYPSIMRSKGLNGFNSAASSYKTYEVKKGDTLWGISEKLLGNGARYKQIMELNSLASDVIFPGQILKIPD